MKTAQSVSLSYLDLTRCSGFPPFNTHLTDVTVGLKMIFSGRKFFSGLDDVRCLPACSKLSMYSTQRHVSHMQHPAKMNILTTHVHYLAYTLPRVLIQRSASLLLCSQPHHFFFLYFLSLYMSFSLFPPTFFLGKKIISSVRCLNIFSFY